MFFVWKLSTSVMLVEILGTNKFGIIMIYFMGTYTAYPQKYNTMNKLYTIKLSQIFPNYGKCSYIYYNGNF